MKELRDTTYGNAWKKHYKLESRKKFTMKHRGFRKYPENNVPVKDCQQKLLSR